MPEPITTQQAFATLKDALHSDSNYAWSWHCNIAMASVDEGMGRMAANRAAARFMQNCFDIDTSKSPEYATLAPVPTEPVGDDLVNEVQRRMDAVVEAAVEDHCADANWPEAADKLSAAIESLLELRAATAPAPVAEPQKFGDGHYCAHHPDDPAHIADCYDAEKHFAAQSPRVCGECGHNNLGTEGKCREAVPNYGQNRDTVRMRACACRCTFPEVAEEKE